MDTFNYTEKQRFTQNEIVYVPVGLVSILFFAVAAQKNLALALAIPVTLFVVARLIARSIRADLAMTEAGLTISVRAVLKESVLIPWSDVSECVFSAYQPLHFGGYGIRWAPQGKGYIVEGKHILKVVFGGKTLFLTVKNRKAAEQALRHFLPSQLTTVSI